MQFFVLLRRRTETYSDADFAPLLEPEAERVRELYAQGSVRAIWSRDDVPGAVSLLEAPSLDEARTIVESYPLMRSGMLELEALVPLRGYRGFGPRGS